MKKKLVAIGFILATALSVILVAAPAAGAKPADTGSITSSYGYGYMKTTRLTDPMRLRVYAYVKDTVCNEEAVVLKWDVRDNDGYLLWRDSVKETRGCGKGSTKTLRLSLAALDYERSGYVAFYLCKDAAIDWGCTDDRVIGWDL